MKRNALVAISLLVSSVMHGQNTIPIKYPETFKSDQQDEYFGTVVKDPYRWLEDDNAPKVKDWVIAENKVTQNYLSSIPFREKIRNRLTDLVNYPKYSAPTRVGEYYIFNRNNGLQNQPVFYVQKGLDGTPSELIDPNKISPDGTSAVELQGGSNDGKYAIYTVAQAGGDWVDIGVIELATQKATSDKISWVKFPSPSWYGKGFFYSGYEKPADGKEFSSKNEFQRILYHKLGESQDKDQVVYQDKKNAQRYVHAEVSSNERYLILYIRDVGKDGMELLIKDLSKPNSEFKTLMPGFDFDHFVIGMSGDQLVINSNHNAPNHKIIVVDPNNPDEKNWKTIIPESADLIKEASVVSNKLFVNYLKDVTSRVYQYDLTGKIENELQLPGLGTVSVESGNSDDKFLFYTYTSFIYPPSVFRYEIANKKSSIQFKTEVKFNVDDYETKQVFYTSKDGTKIPMFLTYKKGMKQDGMNPTLLFAYGGFNLSKYPEFEATHLVLLENGGIYAHANIRGGGEYGENWHKAGMQLNKQNVFDDFIAAAEFLIQEKYTSTPRLAVIGRSNGGLLIGAVVNQRPDLFKVAFPKVGVMDMLRFQKFTVGWGWVNDFGSSDSLRHFKNLLGYSPLHNIREGVDYPAIMVTTADHDDRVVPAHSFKYAATLQEKYKGNNPVLIRIESKSGHGATGKPISKWIEEQTDIFSFMFYNMGLKF